MTNVDEEGKNVFHNSCYNGNEELLKFLIEKASSSYLDILDQVINSIDETGLTPLYLLCLRGYKDSNDKSNKDRTYRRTMIQMMIPEGTAGLNTSAKWNFCAPQILYTPIHWLAYWNDVESIKYLLKSIPLDKITYELVLCANSDGMTPIDIAGKHESHESAIMLLKYLT